MREIDLQIDDFMVECSAKGLSKKTITKYTNQGSIAYRTNLQKNNIHFSRDVFKYLHNQESAFIIVSDFNNFFDSLDHKYLKERLKELSEVTTLPNDYRLR